MYSQLLSVIFRVNELEKVVDFFSGILKFPLKGLAPEIKAVYKIGDVEVVFQQAAPFSLSPNDNADYLTKNALPLQDRTLALKIENTVVFQNYIQALPYFKKNPPLERVDLRGQKWIIIRAPEQIILEFALSENNSPKTE